MFCSRRAHRAREEGRALNGDGSAASRRNLLAGITMGVLLGALVSYGIVIQRVSGSTLTSAVGATLTTTVAAVAAVLGTVRVFRAARGAGSLRRLVLAQAAGGVLGVAAVHALLRHDAAALPWICEHPRQLVNDLVGLFGILAFVWGCARKPMRLEVMIGGLVLVLGYELTAACWHLDGPAPFADVLPWTIQRFVGSEVTASGLGVLTFRLLFA
jgi:hypothetical protein